MTHPIPGHPPPEAVAPLVRGLTLLRALSEADRPQRAADLVRGTGLARATVDRLLGTLASLGYVRLAGREAALAPRLMELGNAYLAAGRIPDLLGPLADGLAEELDESVCLAVPDGYGVRLVHQALRRRAIPLAFRIGDLVPASIGAFGPLFAAAWSADEWAGWARHGAVRDASSFEERTATAARDGWSLDDQSIEPGLVAVALPVRDASGNPVCGAGVVSHTSRYGVASLRDAILPRLREAVAAMEHRLASAAPRPYEGGERTERVPEEGAAFVESLARGLAVVTAFAAQGSDPTLTALAQATGLARATVRRSLITLTHLGYATSDGKHFRLTPRVLDLGFARLSGLTLAELARPHLADLVGQVHDSASMAVLVGDDIQYTARVPTQRIMRVDITLGTRFPAYATALGRVLLAGLPGPERAAYLRRATLEPLTPRTITSAARLTEALERTAREGYALVEDELEEGLRSVAVPVHDRAGTTVGAVNVAMHAGRRTTETTLDTVLPALRATATRIEDDLRVAGRYATIPVA